MSKFTLLNAKKAKLTRIVSNICAVVIVAVATFAYAMRNALKLIVLILSIFSVKYANGQSCGPIRKSANAAPS
jgi:hypothetical protein